MTIVSCKKTKKDYKNQTIKLFNEKVFIDFSRDCLRSDGVGTESNDLGTDNEYTFTASSADRYDRFVLVFGNASENDIFAYQSGSDIIVTGEGELQVFDVMGRMVATQYINGIQTINTPQTGVYIFRLNGKTQKIVVK